MLSVVQTEQGVCEMLGQSSGVNSPYQNKKKIFESLYVPQTLFVV
jgi:hypothetical protein